MSEKNNPQNLIKSFFWKLFEKGGRSVVELIVQIVLARLLAPEQFGMLSIMLVFVNLGNVVVQSGMNTAIIQAPKISQIDCSTVFWMSLFVSFVLYAIIFLSAPVIADFYAMPNLIWPLRALSVLLIINAYNSVQIALITRQLEMRKIFIATVFSSAVSAVCGIGCAFAGFGVWALVAQQLSYQLSNCIAHAIQLDWRPCAEFSLASANRLFGFGSRLLLSGLLDQGYQSISDLIIGHQFSSIDLGLVSQGKRYPQAIGTMIDGAIQPVMLSAVSRLQSDRLEVKRLVRRALKTSTFFVVPVMTLFAVVAPTFIPFLLGEQWSDSVPFLQMYCLVYAMLPVHTTNLQALNGMGRSDLFLKLEVIKKLFGVLAIAITAYIIGDIYLMVGSYIFTGIISTFINSWPNRRVIGYTYGEQVRDIIPAIILSAAATAAAWSVSLLPLSGILLVFIQAAVFVGVFLGLAMLFHVEELAYLVSKFRRLLCR